jgi:dihydroorotase
VKTTSADGSGSFIIRGGRVVCPQSGQESVRDLCIAGGRVVESAPEGAPVVDAAGMLVMPGAIDLACHLRDPGHEEDETLETTLRLALEGGYTTLLALPDTDPVIDRAAIVSDVLSRAARIGGPHVHVMGALTVGMRGAELADLGEMHAAGAVCFGDVPQAPSLGVLRRALEYAGSFGAPVFAFGPHPSLADGGVIAEGAVSTRLGLPGIPVEAETAAVFARTELARLTGTRVFLGFVSSDRACALVDDAQRAGTDVFAGVQPWHLRLDERDHLVRPYDTRLLLDPPLRTAMDRLALYEAVQKSALLVATGHITLSPVEKEVEMGLATPGAPCLAVALALLLDPAFGLTPLAVARATSELPARVLGFKDRGHLAPGARADFSLVDPNAVFVVDEHTGHALSAGFSPLAKATLGARVVRTFVDGVERFRAA